MWHKFFWRGELASLRVAVFFGVGDLLCIDKKLPLAEKFDMTCMYAVASIGLGQGLEQAH